MKFFIKDFFSNVTKCTALSNKAIKRYSEKSIIVPNNLRKNIFRTAAVDNIDVNLKDFNSFHICLRYSCIIESAFKWTKQMPQMNHSQIFTIR